MDSQSSLPLILENAPDIVYALDAEGRFESVNQAALSILEFDRSEILGRSVFDFIHPEDRERLRASLEESIRNRDQSVRMLEFRMVGKSGQVRHFEVNRRLTFDGDRLVRNEGIAHDVTERVREEKRRRVVQGMREEVWKMRTRKDIEKVLSAIGSGLDELGISYEDCGINVVDPRGEGPVSDSRTLKRGGGWMRSDTPSATDLVARWWREGEVVYRRDLEREDTYGERRYLQTHKRIRAVVDVPFSHGTLAINSLEPEAFSAGDLEILKEMAGVLSEGFRRTEDLRDLEDTQSQLVRSEKMAALGNLMAGIAHEINTPVGAVHSMHDTLMRAIAKLKSTIEEEFPDDVQKSRGLQTALKIIEDCNKVIENGTQRVTTIVRSLRNFARIDESALKQVDLHEGLEDTLMLVYHDIKNRIEVVKNYGDLPRICCFPSRLNQVFLNILTNAQQAIEGQGRITISTCCEGGEVRVAIADTGGGVPAENLEKIFDPGFTTKEVDRGTGLGLSICQQIMQEHHGRIEVESIVGEGTTFVVVLPLVVECEEGEGAD